MRPLSETRGVREVSAAGDGDGIGKADGGLDRLCHCLSGLPRTLRSCLCERFREAGHGLLHLTHSFTSPLGPAAAAAARRD